MAANKTCPSRCDLVAYSAALFIESTFNCSSLSPVCVCLASLYTVIMQIRIPVTTFGVNSVTHGVVDCSSSNVATSPAPFSVIPVVT